MFKFQLLITLAASAGMAVAHVERAPALSNGWAEAPFVADDMETTGDGVKNKTTVDTTVTFALHVTERNLDKVKEIAIAVSTPGSSTYGEYLDADTLAALTAPEPAHANAVRSWLRDAVPLGTHVARFSCASFIAADLTRVGDAPAALRLRTTSSWAS